MMTIMFFGNTHEATSKSPLEDELSLRSGLTARKRDKYMLYGETMIKTKDFSHGLRLSIHSILTDQSS